jgi:hypothetical protein
MSPTVQALTAQRGKAANKPTISGKSASRTPPAFRYALLSLARNCQ